MPYISTRRGASQPAPLPKSKSEILDLAVKIAGEMLRRLAQLLDRLAGQIAVEQAVEIADQALNILGQAHIFEALGMEADLLARDVGIILLRDLGKLLAIIGQHDRIH